MKALLAALLIIAASTLIGFWLGYALVVIVGLPTDLFAPAGRPPVRASVESVSVPPVSARLVEGSPKGTARIENIRGVWDKAGHFTLRFQIEIKY